MRLNVYSGTVHTQLWFTDAHEGNNSACYAWIHSHEPAVFFRIAHAHAHAHVQSGKIRLLHETANSTSANVNMS